MVKSTYKPCYLLYVLPLPSHSMALLGLQDKKILPANGSIRTLFQFQLDNIAESLSGLIFIGKKDACEIRIVDFTY